MSLFGGVFGSASASGESEMIEARNILKKHVEAQATMQKRIDELESKLAEKPAAALAPAPATDNLPAAIRALVELLNSRMAFSSHNTINHCHHCSAVKSEQAKAARVLLHLAFQLARNLNRDNEIAAIVETLNQIVFDLTQCLFDEEDIDKHAEKLDKIAESFQKWTRAQTEYLARKE